MLRLAATIEWLRMDRRFEEAIATGDDLLHAAAVLGASEGTTIRYAINARILLRASRESGTASPRRVLASRGHPPSGPGWYCNGGRRTEFE
ncbi:hypothetical protein ACLQ2Y_14265 [Micromonospora echinospora]|uniref:hypothetical protein n=1 Tax=Micromonospora echinospora TaxID=1877 RepID=UPI003CF57779